MLTGGPAAGGFGGVCLFQSPSGKLTPVVVAPICCSQEYAPVFYPLRIDLVPESPIYYIVLSEVRKGVEALLSPACTHPNIMTLLGVVVDRFQRPTKVLVESEEQDLERYGCAGRPWSIPSVLNVRFCFVLRACSGTSSLCGPVTIHIRRLLSPTEHCWGGWLTVQRGWSTCTTVPMSGACIVMLRFRTFLCLEALLVLAQLVLMPVLALGLVLVLLWLLLVPAPVPVPVLVLVLVLVLALVLVTAMAPPSCAGSAPRL
jgi:hypothetical protein